LNLVEIYENMANEEEEPISDYMSYSEFVQRIKKGDFLVVETDYGDFLVIRTDD